MAHDTRVKYGHIIIISGRSGANKSYTPMATPPYDRRSMHETDLRFYYRSPTILYIPYATVAVSRAITDHSLYVYIRIFIYTIYGTYYILTIRYPRRCCILESIYIYILYVCGKNTTIKKKIIKIQNTHDLITHADNNARKRLYAELLKNAYRLSHLDNGPRPRNGQQQIARRAVRQYVRYSSRRLHARWVPASCLP